MRHVSSCVLTIFCGMALSSVAQAETKNWDQLYSERIHWWSLQPLRRIEVPPVDEADWNEQAIDCFLRQRMKQEGVQPAPLADAATLLRRASLTLLGLPPSEAEIAEFLADYDTQPKAALSHLVDRLLQSPHFGERMGRHWLDVVRFTETHGNEWNYDAAYAWRYRDYVIRAFNEDLPYDEFAREHIAGDLLPQPRWNAEGRFNESAIGTAFYRFGEVNHDSCVQFGVIGYDILDNQLDTLSKAFQATTVACARCHDHKMDPVSAKDYHALLGVLRGSRSVMRTIDAPEVNRDAMARLRQGKESIRAELASLWRVEAKKINASALQALAASAKDQVPDLGSPLHVWFTACKTGAKVAEDWSKLAALVSKESSARDEFNRGKFETLADFRHGIPSGWFVDGMGLRDGANSGSDFVPAHEAELAVKAVLPAGVYSFALSDRLNAALRSPTLRRSRAKISFEVVGGRFSLARLVFNHCQLNYNHQHSIHQGDWSWVTIDFPEKTDALRPYAELLTYWDNPKFPDPLGTLGKDTENQREPYGTHAQNPRTWWGLRRIVLHDIAETPKLELTHLSRLFEGEAPKSADEAAARYADIALRVVENFAAQRASDDDIRWLDWLLKSGLFSNKSAASPRLAELSAEYREVENQLASPKTMPALADEGSPDFQPLLERGDYTKPGELVQPGYVRALTPVNFTRSGTGSGRRELAQIIASSENPLTARVMVNRVWQWVFGRGLVGTPDDFGHLGERPSHPELLDYLTARFIADGWSVKRLVRSLVMSRAFQSAAAPSVEARLRDPQNLLLSHFPARRAEAEVIRDSLLAVSDRLDLRMTGPSVHPYREKADTEKRLYTGPLDGDGRRSIYIKFQLMEAPHFLSAFNLPGGKVTQGRRETSNNPAQSLAMLNDPLVHSLAERWAKRLVEDASPSVEHRLRSMFLAALGRPPSSSELARFALIVSDFAPQSETASLKNAKAWKDAAHALFNLKEFIFIP